MNVLTVTINGQVLILTGEFEQSGMAFVNEYLSDNNNEFDLVDFCRWVISHYSLQVVDRMDNIDYMHGRFVLARTRTNIEKE